VVALLDVLGSELSRPAKDVSEVTLNHLLRQALLASAGGGGARGDEEGGALDRLRAHKATAGALRCAGAVHVHVAVCQGAAASLA
jgi:hypothetical protein